MFKPLSHNPYKDFIGKTIKDIRYYGAWVEIDFDDGTSGYFDMSIPHGVTKAQKKQMFIGGGPDIKRDGELKNE